MNNTNEKTTNGYVIKVSFTDKSYVFLKNMYGEVAYSDSEDAVNPVFTDNVYEAAIFLNPEIREGVVFARYDNSTICLERLYLELLNYINLRHEIVIYSSNGKQKSSDTGTLIEDINLLPITITENRSISYARTDTIVSINSQTIHKFSILYLYKGENSCMNFMSKYKYGKVQKYYIVCATDPNGQVWFISNRRTKMINVPYASDMISKLYYNNLYPDLDHYYYGSIDLINYQQIEDSIIAAFKPYMVQDPKEALLYSPQCVDPNALISFMSNFFNNTNGVKELSIREVSC